ncbi:M20 aminoacylase family protein [Neotabrizicola sp. VNH66]|uniref:M20 aminoacylase family protein n=1 Tax=Neotabrizicola sp. VNH66 TaxID=3400918 RepID=UPI003C040DB9
MPIRNRIAEMQPEIAAWRREFHENPELMYDLPWTSARVAEHLRSFGVDEVVTGIGGTGLVGVIRGRGTGGTVGLRADMDALPIHEATGLPYASRTPGKMHACGHDGHTAILLGAAKYLAETRNFAGTVVCIFQPAEEGGAGAKAMIDDGLMDRFGVDEVYGLHNAPGLAAGEFVLRPGPLQASADEFVITVTGKGGHAAEPHMAVDTTLAAAQIVVSLQSIVARNVDPLLSVVVTVGTFRTDSGASNIIPNTAVMAGTVRCLDAAMRDLAEERVKAVATATAAAFGATAVVEYERGYPVTVNHAENAEYAAQAAEAVAGRVDRNCRPIMPAEDFSYMLEARPGAYIFMGNGDTAQCHHPAYDFNDEAIPAGCSYFVTLVENRLPVKD